MKIPVPKLLLSTAVFFGTLAGVEFALRRAGWKPSASTFEFEGPVGGFRTGDRLFVADPERFYSLRPDQRVAPEHLGIYALGKWPFRGAPPEPAPLGIFRIAVVGDSCVYGVGITVQESLPARIQAECAAQLGLDPTHVQVVGFGVPSYTTVQIRALLTNDVLPHYAPDALVLYLAAWNDHAPALGLDDVELRSEAAGRSPWSWWKRSATRAFLHHQAGADRVERAFDAEAIRRAWAAGKPPLGRRVPEADLPRELEAIFDAALAQVSSIAVVLPVHRSRTASNFPGLARDRETVRRIATRRGIACIDSPALFESDAWPADELLFDAVHPAPRGVSIQARAVVEALGARWLRRARSSYVPPWTVAAVEPGELSALGDELLRVRLQGWPRDATEPPSIHLGFAPLLGLHEVGSGVFEGQVMGNSAGPCDLVVSARDGVVFRPGAVSLRPPRLEAIPHPDGVLARLVSRPGDTAHVYVARQRNAYPSRDAPGSFGWLPESAVRVPWPWVCDERGIAEVVMPNSHFDLSFGSRVFAQAKVVPHGAGEAPEAWRWSALLELDLARLR